MVTLLVVLFPFFGGFFCRDLQQRVLRLTFERGTEKPRRSCRGSLWVPVLSILLCPIGVVEARLRVWGLRLCILGGSLDLASTVLSTLVGQPVYKPTY